MELFSQRYGYKSNKIEYENVSATLFGRIWGIFYKQEYDAYDTINWENYTTGIEDMMISMGVPYEFPNNRISKNKNAEALKKFLQNSKWYVIFDFVERYLAQKDNATAKQLVKSFNAALSEEVSGYRVVGIHVVPITNEAELETIKTAAEAPYSSVSRHIEKALALFADRKNPDYENTVKEAISAVEAMCCIITGSSGSNATLGVAIKKLEDHGVRIHTAMKNAFSSLYGYASDENGIRHGGIDFKNVPPEDAKYMLISCSAFINYLIEKWRTANG